jgi:hypothetical protein
MNAAGKNFTSSPASYQTSQLDILAYQGPQRLHGTWSQEPCATLHRLATRPSAEDWTYTELMEQRPRRLYTAQTSALHSKRQYPPKPGFTSARPTKGSAPGRPLQEAEHHAALWQEFSPRQHCCRRPVINAAHQREVHATPHCCERTYASRLCRSATTVPGEAPGARQCLRTQSSVAGPAERPSASSQARGPALSSLAGAGSPRGTGIVSRAAAHNERPRQRPGSRSAARPLQQRHTSHEAQLRAEPSGTAA